MAKRKNTDFAGNNEAVTGPQATPESAPAQSFASEPDKLNTEPEATEITAQSETEAPAGLPFVEAPSISPVISEPVAIAESAIEPKPEPEVEVAKPAAVYALDPVAKLSAEQTAEASNKPAAARFSLKARHKRYARLAASVAIGAALGAVFGALATVDFAKPTSANVAALDDNKAMQQSVAKLAQEVTTLKANLEATNKVAHAQVAMTSDRLKKESAEITGSISAPQTVVAAPLPRPAPRIAMAESQPSARPPVVQGWSIRDSRGGYIYVEGHGDIYQIVPGAPLPGLGPVESIRRLDGRWVVTTPKGIIVSMRDRRYFE